MSATARLIDVMLEDTQDTRWRTRDLATMQDCLTFLFGISETSSALVGTLLTLADQYFTVDEFFGQLVDRVRGFASRYPADHATVFGILSREAEDVFVALLEGPAAHLAASRFLDERLLFQTGILPN